MTTVHNGQQLKDELIRLYHNVETDTADKIMRKLTLDGHNMLVRRSPRLTGFLRSRWAITKNKPPSTLVTGVRGRTYNDPPPPDVRTIKFGDKVTIYNNTEYAYYHEHGTAKIRATPMVAPTYYYLMATARRLVDAANRQVLE